MRWRLGWALSVVFLGAACGIDLPAEDVATIPTRIDGQLQAGDFELADGSVADGYRLMLEVGEELTVVVRSEGEDGIDPYTYAFYEDTREELTHDDDSAGELNSRILLTAVAAGSHVIVVTTYETGLHEGAYEIEIYEGLRPDAR